MTITAISKRMQVNRNILEATAMAVICSKQFRCFFENFLRQTSFAIGYFYNMTKITLKKRISSRIANGHPWVFTNEIDKFEGEIEGGAVVELYTHDKKFV